MKRKSNCLATILFLIYLALLVWIILFKLQFSISDLDKVSVVVIGLLGLLGLLLLANR